MSAAKLLEYINNQAHLGYITGDSESTEATHDINNNKMYIKTDVLEQLYYEPNLYILGDILYKSWKFIARPPDNLTSLDIVVLMLSSNEYSMSPSSFHWPSSNHDTYRFLWDIVNRTLIMNKDCGFLSRYTNLRSSSAYYSRHIVKLEEVTPVVNIMSDNLRLVQRLGAIDIFPSAEPECVEQQYVAIHESSLLSLMSFLSRTK
ncbi:hypothetical protein HDV02_002480 [Globomyces sp. JEL0801]|nr:hypothetical protein HDV02_002480 [Globomyces sp. JEL0801]